MRVPIGEFQLSLDRTINGFGGHTHNLPAMPTLPESADFFKNTAYKLS